jgi:hypothetical protein
VDQSACNMEAPAEQPEYEQNGTDRPKHASSPSAAQRGP